MAVALKLTIAGYLQFVIDDVLTDPVWRILKRISIRPSLLKQENDIFDAFFQQASR